MIDRSSRRAIALLLLAALGADAGEAGRRLSVPTYSVSQHIPGADGSWDYAAIDEAGQRLYVAHAGAATFNLRNARWEPTLDQGAMVSTVLPVPALNRLIFTESRGAALVVAELTTHRILGKISTGAGSDGLAFDAQTGLAAVMAGRDQGFVSLVNVSALKQLTRISVGDDLEFPVSNGHGIVYINVASRGEIAVLDLVKRAIVKRYSMQGCKEPTGLAYDSPSGLLISSCDGMAAILRARDGQPVTFLSTDAGADAVFVDSGRRVAFIPCGDAGTLAVIDLTDAEHPRLAQVVPTQKGARTGAVDPVSGRVYLPVAQLGAVPPGAHWPAAIPGTFQILVLDPNP